MEILQLPQGAGIQDGLIILVAFLVGGACYLLLSGLPRRRRYRASLKPISDRGWSQVSGDFESSENRFGRTGSNRPTAENGSYTSDYVEQLRHVIGASFRKKRVMNKSEFRVFRIIEEELLSVRGGHRILSQTCLGEILDSDDKAAFASINAKRVDVLVIQPNGEPLAVFEFQGKGHYQNMAAARDAVKKEALRKAGVHYLEVNDSHAPDEIRQMVRKVL